MRRATLVAACAAVLSITQAYAAEQPAGVAIGQTDPAGFPTIKTVVTVTDRVGLPVTGLKDTDFGVVEDGKTVAVASVQTLTNLSATTAAVLVLDTSGSMAGALMADAVTAVNSFVDGLGPDAQVGGVSLGAQCVVDPGPGLGTDKAAAKEFFSGAEAGGDTPLYDATLTAVQQSLAAPEGRRAVVVLTDGEDTCSKVSFDTVVSAAVRNGVPLTLIGLGPDVRPDILQNLANLTGGQYFAADDSSKLASIYADLNTRLHTQYALQFRSGQFADRQEHSFVVRVKSNGVEATGNGRFTPPAIAPKPLVSLPTTDKISKPTAFQITNQSPVQLARADVYLDETLLENLTGTTLSYTLDPTGLSGGNHTLRVHVWDSTGAEADTSMAIELADTGIFGRIPFWVVLAVVFLLPVIALVVIVQLNSSRRKLRCPNCRRPLQAQWAACPYCSQPEPVVQAPPAANVVSVEPATPPRVVSTSTVSANGYSGSSDVHDAGSVTRIGKREQPQPVGSSAGTQVLGVTEPAGAWLIISVGDLTGTRFRLGSEETTIGRDSTNDVVLDDVGASRQHARIRRTQSGYQLTDLDTTNGTRLNGKTVYREVLHAGDTIEIGSTQLSFVSVPGTH